MNRRRILRESFERTRQNGIPQEKINDNNSHDHDDAHEIEIKSKFNVSPCKIELLKLFHNLYHDNRRQILPLQS